MRGIIAAVSPEGAIGLGGKIPWHYPADAKRFKRVTMGSTVIMGRATWESLPKRPLPGRRNLVIASRPLAGVETFSDLPSALATCQGDVWFIGGARIYAEAMRYADVIDLVYVPDHVTEAGAICFPPIDSALWEAGPAEPLADDPRLTHRIWRRRS